MKLKTKRMTLKEIRESLQRMRLFTDSKGNMLWDVYGVEYWPRYQDDRHFNVMCYLCGKRLTQKDLINRNVIHFHSRLPKSSYAKKRFYFVCADHFRKVK